MADRTVKVKLVADVSDYTAGLIKAAQQTKALGGQLERDFTRSTGPGLSRAGEKQGGLLAKGIHSGLVRNSPLIAAGIAAALAAGAPAVLAGAGVLFGGIGALAAAQTVEVREAWTGLGHEIRDGAVSDVAVLVPVYVGMADKIGAAFQRMRPEIRDTFEAAAPQIDRFTEGITGAAENALPGLVRAVERGGPVIDGLATLMEDIGTGLSDFLDAMSDDSGAAGTALEGLGDALGAALPLLGELLGTGAEIATDVLPAVAAGLDLTHGVVKLLGPALPPLITGFIAFKAASTAAGFLNTFSIAAQRAGVASSGVGTAVSGASKALPLLAVATMGVTTALSKGEEGERRFEAAVMDATKRLGEGGAEGAKARHELEVLKQVAEESGGTFLGFGGDMEGAFKRGQQAALDLAGAEDVLALATETATAAMSAQADQVMAAANADLAYRMSVDATETAMADLGAAIAEFGAGSEQAADASLAVEQSLLGQAQAAGVAALEMSHATGDSQRKAEADAAQLAELLKLRDQYGSAFPAALNTTIARLQGSTNAGMVAAAQFNQLGLEILDVPNSKTVIVSSTTPEQIKLLESLGMKVRTLPDGTVEVTAETATAENAIAQVARDRNATIRVGYLVTNRPPAGTTAGGLFAAEGGAIERGRLVQHFDGGGAVRGAGGPKADRIPAMLSNGEHVWTAAEVDAAGGQASVAAMRRAVLSGREQPGGFAGGGGSTSVTHRREIQITAVAAQNEEGLARRIVDRQRDLEFLHG